MNYGKTEVVLFTRRYKSHAFKPPKLKGVENILSTVVKYLELILYSKLNWNQGHRRKIQKRFYCTLRLQNGNRKKMEPKTEYRKLDIPIGS